MTVDQALDMPFYHPVIEEALQDTLVELCGELPGSTARYSWRRLAPRLVGT
jgi:hypothetical protein